MELIVLIKGTMLLKTGPAYKITAIANQNGQIIPSVWPSASLQKSKPHRPLQSPVFHPAPDIWISKMCFAWNCESYQKYVLHLGLNQTGLEGPHCTNPLTSQSGSIVIWRRDKVIVWIDRIYRYHLWPQKTKIVFRRNHLQQQQERVKRCIETNTEIETEI